MEKCSIELDVLKGIGVAYLCMNQFFILVMLVCTVVNETVSKTKLKIILGVR